MFPPAPFAAEQTDDSPIEALWTATERLRALEEAAPVAIIGLDLRARVTIWNRAAELMLGWRADEVTGRAFLPFHDPRQTAYLALTTRALTGETVGNTETCRLTKLGDLLPVCFSSAPIRDVDGQLSGTVVTLNDLTSLKRIEAEFLQSQKMEVVGQLAGGIAHDFNNLLTEVLGFADLILERVADRPEVASDVEQVQRAGQRATRLTRQLLAFGRKQAWLPRVLDLNDVVRPVQKMLARMLSKEIELVLVVDGTLGYAKLDPGQIEQILLNLVVNARDAMPQGGTLTIATARVNLDADFCAARQGLTPGPYVTIAVTDTGCGMTPDVQARVFEPFFTTKPVGLGTGLGLSTVQRLVRLGGGCIVVESTPGTGTTMVIHFPEIAGMMETVALQVSPQTVLTGTETILVVDNESAVCQLVQRILERRGYTVLTAGSPRDALRKEQERAGPIDLLISDMIMPGLNGAGLAQQIVGRRPTTAVLFISGYTSDQSIDDVSNRHAGFLQKPFTANALAEKVRDLLDSRMASTPLHSAGESWTPGSTTIVTLTSGQPGARL